MPDQWRQVFDSHNMIWVGAKRDQKNTPEPKLVWMAILGSRAIEQDYAIDLNRLYIGSSGNGAMTALNTMLYANEIVGAVYMSGSMYWGSIDPERLESLRRKYHVFITGTNDKAKATVRADFEKYKKDGIENVKLIFEMDRLGNMPEPEHMDEAIRYLDSRMNR
jgi:predicted esterase